MSNSNNKRPVVELEESDSSSNEEDSGDEEMGEEEELGENDREIQVDFEGQSPIPEDFSGIKSLMHQLFLKAHINLSGIADLIIQQSFVGSILRVIHIAKSLAIIFLISKMCFRIFTAMPR